MSNGELGIQKMLVQRLQRRIESLERERDSLTKSLRQLGDEVVAKVYVLEVERDEASALKRGMEEGLMALDSELSAAEGAIRGIRSEIRALLSAGVDPAP